MQCQLCTLLWTGQGETRQTRFRISGSDLVAPLGQLGFLEELGVRFWWGKGWKIIGTIGFPKGTRISRVWGRNKVKNHIWGLTRKSKANKIWYPHSSTIRLSIQSFLVWSWTSCEKTSYWSPPPFKYNTLDFSFQLIFSNKVIFSSSKWRVTFPIFPHQLKVDSSLEHLRHSLPKSVSFHFFWPNFKAVNFLASM